MQLCDHDRRILAEMNDYLSKNDPKLARKLVAPRSGHGSRTMLSLIASVLPGLIFFLLAVLTGSPALLMVGIIVTGLCIYGIVMWRWASKWV